MIDIERAALNWTAHIRCWACHNSEYHVIDGVWTCTCGSPMTVAEVAEYHARMTNAN